MQTSRSSNVLKQQQHVTSSLLEVTLSEVTFVCRATRALHFCGQETMEAAVTWLSDHADDTGLDEPLLVPKVHLHSRH